MSEAQTEVPAKKPVGDQGGYRSEGDSVGGTVWLLKCSCEKLIPRRTLVGICLSYVVVMVSMSPVPSYERLPSIFEREEAGGRSNVFCLLAVKVYIIFPRILHVCWEPKLSSFTGEFPVSF